MQLGIMTRVFRRSSLEAIADGILENGFRAVQLNLTSAGLESLPAALDPAVARDVGAVFRSRRLEVAAVSGTFNTTHPDPAERADGIHRLSVLASRCEDLGTKIVTLCTGTRDPHNMWRGHPANGDPAAWYDLTTTIRRLLVDAEKFDLTLAFEPELANVVDSAEKAERLIREIDSPRLRVLIDAANLVHPEDLGDTQPFLEKAFAHVGQYISLAHAKDVGAPGPGKTEYRKVAPGQGSLDYPAYMRLLHASRFQGSIILQDLQEHEIPACKAYLESLLTPNALLLP